MDHSEDAPTDAILASLRGVQRKLASMKDEAAEALRVALDGEARCEARCKDVQCEARCGQCAFYFGIAQRLTRENAILLGQNHALRRAARQAPRACSAEPSASSGLASPHLGRTLPSGP